jgi:hypothetical protein
VGRGPWRQWFGLPGARPGGRALACRLFAVIVHADAGHGRHGMARRRGAGADPRTDTARGSGWPRLDSHNHRSIKPSVPGCIHVLLGGDEGGVRAAGRGTDEALRRRRLACRLQCRRRCRIPRFGSSVCEEAGEDDAGPGNNEDDPEGLEPLVLGVFFLERGVLGGARDHTASARPGLEGTEHLEPRGAAVVGRFEVLDELGGVVLAGER